MIGILYATQEEAAPFMRISGAIQVDRSPFAVYQAPDNPLLLTVVSGIGKVCAAVACQAMIREYGVMEILNAGVCGALRTGPAYLPGNLFCVTSCVEGDHEIGGDTLEPRISDGRLDWDLPAARLVTCDRAVFDGDRRGRLSALGDLVDMEGAVIARVAAMYNTPWTMVKGVTDAAGPIDRAVLQENLASVSEAIATLIWDGLNASADWRIATHSPPNRPESR